MKRCGILIAVLVALLAYRQDTNAQKQATEDEVKVGLIFKLGIYVEWPTATLPNPETPMVICVLEDDPFASLMRTMVGTKTINGHKLVVRSPKWPKAPKDSKELRDSRDLKDSKDFKELRECHMLYISQSESARGDELIRMMKGFPTLTIADFPNFTRHGGHINFILEDDHVLLEVNPEAAKQSDLIPSSNLLKSARIIQTAPGWR